MKTAFFRFYEELNDFLPEEKRKVLFEYPFSGSPSVKDAVEALSVPHTEIDLILVNNTSVDFSYNLCHGDMISVYPVFESFNIKDVQHLRPLPLRNPKFVLDVHLGSLTRNLRMCGFDSSYRNDLTEENIIQISLEEKRTILTKNRDLLKHNDVLHAYWVRSADTDDQLIEVLQRFHLESEVNAFTRCMECNGMLISVDAEKVRALVPPKVLEWQNDFRRCDFCGRIYWKGSHYEKMNRFIDDIRKKL